MKLFIYIPLLLQLLVVAVIDFRSKKISNYWIMLNMVIFAGLLIFMPDLYSLIFDTFLLPVIFLIVGFILYLLKIMGAGDAKYLFSFFLLIPLNRQSLMLESLLYSVILVGLSLIIMTVARYAKEIMIVLYTKNWKGLSGMFGSKFPLAPVILIAWFLVGWREYL